jgi:tetratricopeptide (TPR) repeat protein
VKVQSPLRWPRLCLLFLLAPLLAACETPPDEEIATKVENPAERLLLAAWYYEERNSPRPAERLIREAIQIYQAKGDRLGLGHAYRSYGLFLRSDAVKRAAELYTEEGFLDPGITFDNRLAQSIAYLERAATLYEEEAAYGWMINAELQIGYGHHFQKQTAEACAAFDRSLDVYRQHRDSTEAALRLPPGESSYESFVAAMKDQSDCPQ